MAANATTGDMTTTCYGNDSHCNTVSESSYIESEQILSRFVQDLFVILFVCILGPPLNAAATIANIINITVFCKIGFAEPINISLVALAVSDLCGLITLQWRNICLILIHTKVDVPFDSNAVQYLTAGNPHFVFARITGFITAYITFERCMCVVMPLKVKVLFTRKSTIAVTVSIFVAMLIPIIPFYFVNGLDWKFDETRNLSFVGLIMRENRNAVEKITYSINSAYTFAAFLLVTVFTTILIQRLRTKSRWRDRATSYDVKATSSSLKDRKVIVMVTMISSVFILCFLPNMCFFLTKTLVPGFDIVGRHSHIVQCLIAFGFFLEEINAGVNTFIYVKMSSRFREAFYQSCCFKRNTHIPFES